MGVSPKAAKAHMSHTRNNPTPLRQARTLTESEHSDNTEGTSHSISVREANTRQATIYRSSTRLVPKHPHSAVQCDCSMQSPPSPEHCPSGSPEPCFCISSTCVSPLKFGFPRFAFADATINSSRPSTNWANLTGPSGFVRPSAINLVGRLVGSNSISPLLIRSLV